ncbi:MAG: FecR family protein, partial [Myxococcota bacterium]
MKRERTDLGAHIELPSEEARMARVWSGIERKLDHRPTRLRSAGWALAGATAVASMVGVAVWWPGSEAGPLEVDRFASPEMGLTSLSDKGGSLGWSDGSRVEMTEATQLELLENTGERVTFLLHRGEARFRIVPGGPRRWVVEMGDLSVEVLGTVFVVKRSVAGAELVVEQGRVLARSDRLPNRVRRIEAQSPGARLFLPRAPTEERPSPPAAAEPQPRPSPEKAPRPPPPSAAPRRLDDGPPKTSPRAESKIRPRPAQSASTVEARGSPDLKPRGGSATPLPSFASRMEAADEARR